MPTATASFTKSSGNASGPRVGSPWATARRSLSQGTCSWAKSPDNPSWSRGVATARCAAFITFAGIGLRGSSAPEGVRNYLAVDDVDATLAKVTESGGTIVVPKTDIGIGWYAAVTDTEGNELGLYRSKREG